MSGCMLEMDIFGCVNDIGTTAGDGCEEVNGWCKMLSDNEML